MFLQSLVRSLVPFCVPVLLAGCAGDAPAPSGASPGLATSGDADAAAVADPDQVAALAMALQTLSPSVSAAEATRAAGLAHSYPLALARDWGVVDPPYAHNLKVLYGIKPRGTCWHFAVDLRQRLAAEGFETLELHLALAEPAFRLDHAAVVLSARGAPMHEGIVLDAWRIGQGRLFWAPVEADTRYDWDPIDMVRARRAARSGG